MTLTEFKNRWVSIGEMRFERKEVERALDIVHYLQVKEKVPGAHCALASTLVLDLLQPQEAILEKMNDTTRYEIRRAESKDQLIYGSERKPSADQIEEFCQFFARFASFKNLALPSARVLRAYAENNLLDLSWVQTGEGKVLSWHVNYMEKNRVRQLHAATLRFDSVQKDKHLVSRANRWHHWQDILHFQNEGCAKFDFGGIPATGGTQSQKHIAAFKEQFGGIREDGFNCELSLTLRGRVFTLAKSLLSRTTAFRHSLQNLAYFFRDRTKKAPH